MRSPISTSLAFAERVLPRASDLWVQASLNQKQRLQQLFFGDGVAFDGKQFVRTAVRANAFNYLTAPESSQNEVAFPTSIAGEVDGAVLQDVASPPGRVRVVSVLLKRAAWVAATKQPTAQSGMFRKRTPTRSTRSRMNRSCAASTSPAADPP